MIRRRWTLAALGVAYSGWLAVVPAAERAPQSMTVLEPVAQIADGIDPDTPLAVIHDCIASRRQDVALWVLDATGRECPRHKPWQRQLACSCWHTP